MMELTRSVRFSLPLGRGSTADALASPRANTYAGWPAPDEFSAFFDLRITCRGLPDPESGYLIGIGEIDDLVRAHGIPLLAEHVEARRGGHPALLLRILADRLRRAFPVELTCLDFSLGPRSGVRLEKPDMTERYILRQQFDFAAAHRLAVPAWDAAQNEATFGHCCRRHGHNYRLEVSVSAAFPEEDEIPPFTIGRLDAVVQASLLSIIDHRDLNEDVPEFARRLPSVENIARFCFDRLAPAFREAGVRLEAAEVWETEKTSCRITNEA